MLTGGDDNETAQCDAVVPAGSGELCNNRDDDCDGVTDNGFELGTACDGGDADDCPDGRVACTIAGGVECVDGPEVGVETCDGVDNDCNGTTDDGCDNDGDDWCDGAMVCVDGPNIVRAACPLGCGDCNDGDGNVRPGRVEACNDRDDDCDGATDEGCDDDNDGWCDAGLACTTAPSICATGCGDCADDVAAIHPSATERCNGIDDDCDGTDDEGFAIGATCYAGLNACRTQGETVCTVDGAIVCDAVPAAPVAELCNGIDDDCNGVVDNGFAVGGQCSAGLGECARTGIFQCGGNGAIVCSAASGPTSDEVCDGKDNDCDGMTDESTSAVPLCAPIDTEILVAPERVTSLGVARFVYIDPVTPTNVLFECSLDGGDWAPCDGGEMYYAGLAQGGHVFLVRVIGPDGSVDPTPAYHGWTIDRSVPDTIILAGPDDPSQSGTAEFFLGASVDDVSHWMCALDPRQSRPRANDYVRCDALTIYEGLADGDHVLWVYVVDGKGTADPEPASYRWTIDSSAPETAITFAPPAHATDSEALFEFADPEDTSVTRFECRLDDGPWQMCDGGQMELFELAPGEHVFQVRSVDEGGVVDPTPATHVWTVDQTPPDTAIPVHPEDPAQSERGTFGFTANEAPVTFQCTLDPVLVDGATTPPESAWRPCAATWTVGPLADGDHVLWVRAVDAGGLVDATPAMFAWHIDTRAPDTVISAGPAEILGSEDDADFTFEDPDAPDHEGYECRVDGGAWVPCDSGAMTLTAEAMAEGAHTFEVRTCVEDGPVDLRCDPSPAIWRWAVSDSICPLDDMAPLLVCAADFAVECVAGGAEVDFSALAPTVADACGAPVAEREGGPLVVGDNPIVFRATDGNGNTSSCLTVVAVVDDTPPTITCPADVEVDNDVGVCGAGVAIEAALVADGCDAAEALVVVNDAPPLFAVGTTTVTHRVVDGAGHTTTCTQRVTVHDVEVPLLTCDATLTVDAAADACAWEGSVAATSSDNCGEALSIEEASGTFPVGVMPIVFTARDQGGHKHSCTTTLTVRDVTAPTVTCGVYDGSTPTIVRAGIADACGATAVIRALTCTLSDDDGVEVALEACPLVARDETLEIAAWPSQGELVVRYEVEAQDAADNLTTTECTFTVPRDRDGDRVVDARDVCPTWPDPDQIDQDGDGIGDRCDVCPELPDPAQADRDNNGIGDVCDPNEGLTAGGGGGCGTGGTGALVLGLVVLLLGWSRRRSMR